MKKILSSVVIAGLGGLLLAVTACSKAESPIDNPAVEKPQDHNTDNKPDSQPDGNASGTTDNDATQDKLFVYKALIDDVTGTWCPACPYATEAINKAKSVAKYADRFVVLATHFNNYGFAEPMHITGSRAIVSLFQSYERGLRLTGFPHLMLNREVLVNSRTVTYAILEHLEKQLTSPIGIKIASALDEKSGKVTVSFKSKERFDDLKYHVFVVEDNIIARQSYGGIYIDDYRHNDVMRTFYGYASGADLGTLQAGYQEVTKADLPLSYNLLSAQKLENVRIVVFVTDASGKVLNTQVAKANQLQEYQYAK